MDKISKTCKELLLGMVLVGIVAEGVLVVLTLCNALTRLGYLSVGLWVGIALGLLYALHMDYTVKKSVNMENQRAVGYQRGQYMLRMALLALVLALFAQTDQGSVLLVFAGLLTLKCSAYCNPLIGKLTKRNEEAVWTDK